MGLELQLRDALIGANGFIACQPCHGRRTVHQILGAVEAMQTLLPGRANSQMHPDEKPF